MFYMKKKKKIYYLIIAAFLIIANIFLIKTLYNNNLETQLLLEQTNSINANNYVTIYVENENNEYELYDSTDTFSSTGYTLDTNESYCENGSSFSWINNKIKLSLTSSDSCILYFEKSEILFSNKILIDSVLNETGSTMSLDNSINYIENKNANFSEKEDTEVGMYAAEDDIAISYYFRGSEESNYVLFAGMLWRIIRIDGEGNIKLMLFNENEEENSYNGINSSKYKYSTLIVEPYFVGYMYSEEDLHGDTNDSLVKSVIDTWYEENLLNSEEEKIISTTAIYCNDRSSYTTTNGTIENSSYSTSNQYFGAYIRLETNKNPTLICKNEKDAFTVEDTSFGNGSLKYSIALITADEVAMAGGIVELSQDNNFYLNADTQYWTLTPYYYNNKWSYNFYVDGSGELSFYTNISSNQIFPVISLISSTLYESGNGTISDPYIVS